MATGFALNGTCYASADTAFSAFQSSFPLVDGAAVVTLSSASLAGSVIDYTLSMVTATNVDAVARSGSIALTACESVSAAMTDNMSGILFAMLIAFFTAFFLRKAVRKFALFGGGFTNDF